MAAQLNRWDQSTLDHARRVLEASVIDHDSTTYAFHCGALEVVLDRVIKLVEQLTEV